MADFADRIALALLNEYRIGHPNYPWSPAGVIEIARVVRRAMTQGSDPQPDEPRLRYDERKGGYYDEKGWLVFDPVDRRP